MLVGFPICGCDGLLSLGEPDRGVVVSISLGWFSGQDHGVSDLAALASTKVFSFVWSDLIYLEMGFSDLGLAF